VTIWTTIARAFVVTSATVAALAFSAAGPAFGRVSIDYKSVATFGSAGSAPDQFQEPVGVAVDESDEDVYVADAGNRRIERFEAGGAYVSQIDGAQTPAKAFSEPLYVAVDNSSGAGKGRVYVGDRGRGVVDVFNSSGEYLLQIPVPGVLGIAVDFSGHLWAWTRQPSITEYDESGGVLLSHHVSISIASSPGIGVDSRGNVYVMQEECPVRYTPPVFEDVYDPRRRCSGDALAVDPVSGEVFQGGQTEVVVWPPYGEGPGLWERVDETITGGFTDSQGLAVNGATGRLYVSDESADDVEIFDGTAAVAPVIDGVPIAEDASRSGVAIHVTIDPRGSHAEYRVRYVEAGAYAQSAADPYEAGGMTSSSSVPASNGSQEVERSIEGLKPETTYHYEVIAVNQAGSAISSDATFTTAGSTPPSVETGASGDVTQNAATIGGVLDTNGLPSTYGFEIGTTTDYGPATGLGSVGAGLAEAFVSLKLTGLQPGTTYHYRLTATNVDGTSYGADQTFTTSTFAGAFATPPAPLPFVTVPVIAFPAQTSGSPVHRTTKRTKAKVKVKKHKRRKRSESHKKKR
jgi:hypothetical protein